MFRVLHRLYAAAAGYFWLPCPVCGEHYGGHEISNIITGALVVQEADGPHAYCVCPKPECSEEALRRNMENGHPQAVDPGAGGDMQKLIVWLRENSIRKEES